MEASSGIRIDTPSATTDRKSIEAKPSEASTLELAQSSAQSIRALIGLKLAPLGLAPGQDRLLLALGENGCLTISALADMLNVRPSTVSKVMDRVAERGLAVRKIDDGDARRTVVELTEQGRSTCLDVQALCDDIEEEIQTDLTADEIKRMRQGLALFDQAVARCLRRLR